LLLKKAEVREGTIQGDFDFVDVEACQDFIAS
jgi:hypothetical protein